MKITIIGASAGVGLATTKRALERHHDVTTLARSEIALPASNHLTTLKGSATSKADLTEAIRGSEAVIVALGTGKSMKQTTLYSDFARVLVEVAQELKFSAPIIVLTGFGAGESAQYHDNFIMRMFFKFLLKDVYDDKSIMEKTITESNLNWIIVRPGLLKDLPLTEQYRVEERLFKGMKIGPIGRADVADFMVKQAENPSHVRQYPALSNQ